MQIEKIDLHQISMRQRKHIGMLCQRHFEDSDNPGTIKDLCLMLREYVNTYEEKDTKAARWILSRLVADPLAEINYRRYILELLYG